MVKEYENDNDNDNDNDGHMDHGVEPKKRIVFITCNEMGDLQCPMCSLWIVAPAGAFYKPGYATCPNEDCKCEIMLPPELCEIANQHLWSLRGYDQRTLDAGLKQFEHFQQTGKWTLSLLYCFCNLGRVVCSDGCTIPIKQAACNHGFENPLKQLGIDLES